MNRYRLERMKTYAEWIASYVERFKDNPLGVRGMCESATLEMCVAFPELERVKGHVLDLTTSDYPQPHWWCITRDSLHTIVDPTASQFGPCLYTQIRPGMPEPTGKCPNCGNYCWDGGLCCSKTCLEEFGKSIGIEFWRKPE